MRPVGLVGQRGGGRWAWPGPASAPSAPSCARRPRVVVVVGGYASFPAGLAAVLTRVPLVSREHRRRAGRRQRPARPLRRRQRRGLRRDGPAPGPRHRHAGAARARLAGSDARGPGRQPGGARPARPTARPWRAPAARSARGGSTVPWRTWRARGPAATTARSTTSPVGGTTRRSLRPGPSPGRSRRSSGDAGRRPVLPGGALRGPACPTSTTRPTSASSGPAP